MSAVTLSIGGQALETGRIGSKGLKMDVVVELVVVALFCSLLWLFAKTSYCAKVGDDIVSSDMSDSDKDIAINSLMDHLPAPILLWVEYKLARSTRDEDS